MVDVLSRFLGSKTALFALGLPGLALLLAYFFYSGLIKAKIIRPLTSTQGFVVLLAIIVYFSGSTALFAYYYDKQHPVVAHDLPPAPQSFSPVATGTPEEDKVANLMRRARIGTPLERYNEVLGQPVSAETDGYEAGIKNYLYELDDGRAVQVSTGRNNQVLAIAGYDRTSELPIPTLHAGWIRQDGSVASWESLKDITLGSVMENCEWRHDSYAQTKMGNFFVGPCYFGKPGSYNNFTFLFMIGDKDPDCTSDAAYDKSKKVGPAWVKSCSASTKRPIGFIVTGDGDEPDSFKDDKIAPYQAARMSFVDYIIGDGPH